MIISILISQFWDLVFKPSSFIVLVSIILLYLLYLKHSEKFRFFIQIFLNILKVLLKKNKKIEKIELHYSYKSVFANSYFIIKYNFENAIWFKFIGITTKSRSGEIVFNSSNIKSKEIKLVVQGFFRKQVYHIEIHPTLELKSDHFRTTLKNLSDLQEKFHAPIFQIAERKTILSSFIIELKNENPVIKKSQLKLNLSPYNQNHFL